MKKIKLKWMKLTYWLDLHLGFWLVNGRKFSLFLKQMQLRKVEIQDLEEELMNK